MSDIQKHAQVVIDLLELGDTRLMASDGPCGGKLPDLSPEEWGRIYRACKAIARIAQRDTRETPAQKHARIFPPKKAKP